MGRVVAAGILQKKAFSKSRPILPGKGVRTVRTPLPHHLTSCETCSVSVVKAGCKFELLATNRLPDEFTAFPAVSQGRIYLRGFRALYAISEEAT
jgi:hypothetical protein